MTLQRLSSLNNFSLTKMLMFFIISLCLNFSAKAQITLDCEGTKEITSLTSEDFIIPEGVSSITIELKGGDGGNAELDGFTCNRVVKGGGGATVNATFEVGSLENQLQPGGKLRVFVGQVGTTEEKGCAPVPVGVYGAGGGSTAVLYQDVIFTNKWRLLAEAGAGGGAGRVLAGVFKEGLGGNDSAGGDDVGDTSGGTLNVPNHGCPEATFDEISNLHGRGGQLDCERGGNYNGDAMNSVINGNFSGSASTARMELLPNSDVSSRGGSFVFGPDGGDGFSGGGSGGGGGGGGGGFGGGATQVFLGGGGGGSFYNVYYLGSDKSMTAGGDGAGSKQNGYVNITTESIGRLNCKASVEVALDGSGSGTVFIDDLKGNDVLVGCDQTLALVRTNPSELNIVSINVNCSNIGTTIYELWLIEDNELVLSCQSEVKVVDNIAPNVICKSYTLDLNPQGTGILDPSQMNNNSTDNCGTPLPSIDNTSVDCSDIGTSVVTLTITDGSGNTATCNSSVTVQDVSPPNAVCKDITKVLDDTGNVSISVDEVDNASNDACGVSNISLNTQSFDCSNVGDNSITLTVIDNYGNQSSCTAIITIEDETPPTPLCKSTTVQLDENGNGQITPQDIDNGSTDACSGGALSGNILNMSIIKSDFDCGHIGNNTITLFVTDASNNTANCTANVTVEDNIAPIVACQNIIREFNASGETITIGAEDVNNGSTDNCGIASLSINQTSFDCSATGLNNVVLTVTDENGNSSICSATVTIEDNIAPIALCKDHTLQLNANGNGSIIVFNIDNESYDACSTLNATLDINSFSCTNVGDNTITLTVTDDNGNSSNCEATVTVEDHMAPTAMCNDVTISLDGNGTRSLSVAEVDNNSFDNCQIASKTLSQTQFSCSDMGTKNVTLNIVDVNGNTSSCISNITTEMSGGVPDGWRTNDIGQTTIGNDYWYDPCDAPPTYYVTGSGNNAIGTTSDNVAFTSYNTCGDFTLTAKIESIDPNGYGGLMVREGMDAGNKQVALFSNQSNILRHEVRYTSNGTKQVGSFFKPNPVWLRIQRQGNWIFSHSSFDGVNFQYVHGVFLQMANCLEIGMASFTYLPSSQTEAVFSNVTVGGSNGSFSENNPPPFHQSIGIPENRNTLNLFPNPNKGRFIIQLDESIKEQTTLHIYNHYGQQVHNQQIQEGGLQVECYLDQLPAGMYWLKIGEGHTFATKTFMLAR